MAFQFLCATHRQQLSRSPVVSEQRWEEWMEAGRLAFADRDWSLALRFLGCSFELSEIMLSLEPRLSLVALDRYMVSGHFLAEGFANAGNPDLQLHCLLAVHHRLLSIIRSPEGQGLALKNNVEFSLQMLSRFYSERDNAVAFEHCERESRRLLQRCYH